MPESLQDFERRIAHFTTNMHGLEGAVTGLTLSFGHMLKRLFVGEAAFRTFNTAINSFPLTRALNSANEVLNTHAHSLHVFHKEAISEANELALAHKNATGNAKAQFALELDYAEKRASVLRQSIEFKRLIEGIDKRAKAVYSGVLVAIGSSVHAHAEVNEKMMEANSALTTRIALTESVINVQRSLGSGLQETADAAKALVSYGYELDAGFTGNVKLVTQLTRGLGLASDQAAELFVVFDRQLKSPVREVADAITRIVTDTGLAAGEASKLAANLGRAIALLKPGIGKDLSGMVELVGRYEGALRELGGQAGGFQELLSRMTTPEGIQQASMLGVQDPASLMTKEGAEAAAKSFSNYVSKFMGSSQGWERAVKWETLGSLFNMTAQQANLMAAAVKRANEQQHTATTLSERYEQQMTASMSSFQALADSFKALAQQAVLPLIPYIADAAKGLADLTRWMSNSPVALGVLRASFVVAGVAMAGTAVTATRQFMQLAAALTASAAAARANAAASVLNAGNTSALLGGGKALKGAGTLAGWFAGLDASMMLFKQRLLANIPTFSKYLPTLTTGLLNIGTRMASILLRVIPVIGAALAAWNIGRWVQEAIEKKLTTYDKVSLNTEMAQFYQTKLQDYAAKADAKNIESTLASAHAYYLRQGYTEERIAVIEARMARGLAEGAGRARFAIESSMASQGPDSQDSAHLKAMAEGQKAIVELSEKHHEVAVKSVSLMREQIDRSVQKDEEDNKKTLLDKFWGIMGEQSTEANMAY